jgi:hypothetical protein
MLFSVHAHSFESATYLAAAIPKCLQLSLIHQEMQQMLNDPGFDLKHVEAGAMLIVGAAALGVSCPGVLEWIRISASLGCKN